CGTYPRGDCTIGKSAPPPQIFSPLPIQRPVRPRMTGIICSAGEGSVPVPLSCPLLVQLRSGSQNEDGAREMNDIRRYLIAIVLADVVVAVAAMGQLSYVDQTRRVE